MAQETFSLTGKQLLRSIEAAGGLWTHTMIAEALGQTVGAISTILNHSNRAFPDPVWKASNTNTLYAGTDILTWLESEDRLAAARKVRQEITRIRRR